jgi:hypothetical protein
VRLALSDPGVDFSFPSIRALIGMLLRREDELPLRFPLFLGRKLAKLELAFLENLITLGINTVLRYTNLALYMLGTQAIELVTANANNILFHYKTYKSNCRYFIPIWEVIASVRSLLPLVSSLKDDTSCSEA